MLLRRTGVYLLMICLLPSVMPHAQTPAVYSSADIYLQLKKLKVLGSVLYVAAHPDDENNTLLPYLAKERQYRTGYLSLTRGDGGQNLIGSEQGVELGLIRTQELLAARRVDGAEQFFSSAYEFGFSKSAAEALSIWDKNTVLGDMVWVIRQFQPDVILTRFPGDARAGHGHHWASALLAGEAFKAAADPKQFPEQLTQGVRVWQAKRIMWNNFNFGNVNTITSDQLKIEVGGYDPLIGKSPGELGGEARSMHKSQGEGRPRRKGELSESFVTIDGDTAKTDIMDGIITDWTRIDGGKEIQRRIDHIIRTFNFEHPEYSVDSLVELYKNIQRISYRGMWWKQKIQEVQDAIFNCSALFSDATTKDEFVLLGDSAAVSLVVNKRNDVKITLDEMSIGRQVIPVHETLKNNQNYTYDIKVKVSEPPISSETQPYWLQQPQTAGNFSMPEQALVGHAWNDALLNARFTFSIDGISFKTSVPVQYKYVDPVKGEVYQPFVLIPHVSVSVSPQVALMNVKTETGKLNNDSIYITYKSNFTKQNVPFGLYVLQDTIKTVLTDYRNFEKEKSYTVGVPVSKYYNPAKGQYVEAAVKVWPDSTKGLVFSQFFRSIEYNHIPNIHYSFKDHIKFVTEEVRTIGHKIGYIAGAGDKMPESLKEMGYEVKILTEADIKEAILHQYDAIVVGIRAYNIYDYLTDKNDVLNNYVKNGGNLIVQYIKSNQVGNRRIKMGPYPFSISAGIRVTEENATVNFLLPQHTVLNYPNKITEKDFDGWIQERSTYQADQVDPHFEAPLGMNDTGEKQSNGSLIIAKYGKGNFAYVSLVLFRQLPAGVPGSFRLLANLIALPKN